MGAAMTRYLPSRRYLWGGLAAWGLAALSGVFAIEWAPALIAVVLFLISSGLLVFLALRPPVEIRESHLIVGNRAIPWGEIRRVDRTGWISPLVVRLTFSDDSRMLLIYPGDLDSANSLLRHLRRHSREAQIDGRAHREFWGDALPAVPERKEELPSPRYRLLRPEDEAEVERMFHQLKTVGRLDQNNSSDEK
jgi:hypothetical protein